MESLGDMVRGRKGGEATSDGDVERVDVSM